jgi:hypothetical protein
MPRINTSALRTQILTTAKNDELRVASGTNNLISRSEQAMLGADLNEAADIARARNPGRAPTVGAVLDILAEKVDAGIASVNQASGSGKAFVSKQEIENLAARDPLMGMRVQRAVDALSASAPPAPSTLTGVEVEAQLNAHVGSMFFDGILGSEGGEPISVVRVATSMGAPPTGNALAIALGHDPTTDKGFVERYKAVDASLLTEIQQSNGDTPDAKKVIELLRGLSDLRVIIVGKDGAPGVDANHPTYFVGTAADGQLVGIKTGVIWT